MSVAEWIYTRSQDGRLEPLKEERFASEDVLQELLARHPELLDGEQMRPGDPRRWILVRREQGIPDTPGSGSRWSLDHLLIDQDAVPTLVEVKRGANPEVRRTVVGQLLEYAAHAPQAWTADKLRRGFEQSASDPESDLRELLQADDEADAGRFWEDVATNLAAKRLRLLFVADAIPDELARIVEFLNEQMPNVEVLAVEIKQFGAGDNQTLVPRVIGRSAKPRGSGGNLTLDEVVDRFPEGPVRSTVQRLIENARAAGATFEPEARGFSIRAQCRLWSQPVTVAWLYPSDIGWMRTRHFSFGAALFGGYDPPPPKVLQDALFRYAREFEADPFTHDASSKGVIAHFIEPGDAVEHTDVLVGRLNQVLADLKDL